MQGSARKAMAYNDNYSAANPTTEPAKALDSRGYAADASGQPVADTEMYSALQTLPRAANTSPETYDTLQGRTGEASINSLSGPHTLLCKHVILGLA